MLTDTQVKTKQHKNNECIVKTPPYKLADEKCLYLFVQTGGGRLWRFDYRFDGKRKTLALDPHIIEH